MALPEGIEKEELRPGELEDLHRIDTVLEHWPKGEGPMIEQVVSVGAILTSISPITSFTPGRVRRVVAVIAHHYGIENNKELFDYVTTVWNQIFQGKKCPPDCDHKYNTNCGFSCYEPWE